jgi:hypothetical protein
VAWCATFLWFYSAFHWTNSFFIRANNPANQ